MYIKSFVLNIQSKNEISYNNKSVSLNKKKFKYLEHHFKVELMDVQKLK